VFVYKAKPAVEPEVGLPEDVEVDGADLMTDEAKPAGKKEGEEGEGP